MDIHCRYISNGEMNVRLCTSLVGSYGIFKNTDTHNFLHPYKKYRKIYPRWTIPDDKSLEVSLYWKWLVGHYTSEIARAFPGMKETTISSEWKALSWNDVRKDLNEVAISYIIHELDF